MLNVCDNNVYEAQTCTLFYYSTDKCTGRWSRGSTPKDGVYDPRRSLANKVPFPCCTASQTRDFKRGPPFTTCVKLCQMHNNFQIFKFRDYLISYTKLFTKLNLQYFTLRYIYYNENFQI